MVKPNFDAELSRGVKAYNGIVGQWWSNRSRDRYHQSAYSHVVAHLASYIGRDKARIVDYACGTGKLINRLTTELPSAKIIGIDGSKVMLREARVLVCAPVNLLYAKLPSFELPSTKADAVTFTFPNIITGTRERAHFEKRFSSEASTARFLSHEGKQMPQRQVQESYDLIFMNRMISRNLRCLLTTGGVCVRLEYAQTDRDKLSARDQIRTAYEEGSLARIDGKMKVRKLFDLVSTRFFRSKVISDLVDQTGDPDFLEGGYTITILRAV